MNETLAKTRASGRKRRAMCPRIPVLPYLGSHEPTY